MGPTSTSTITCRSRRTRSRRARWTTTSARVSSRARKRPASASSTRTSTARSSTRIPLTRGGSTCWSARTTISTSRRRAATKTPWRSRWRGCVTTIGTEAMKLFYGWVIVGVGIVVTCVGFGAMASLTVFLQPMAEAMGWSRTGVSTAALINWLCMGVGAFVWGALSDRFGTRAVVLGGGLLLGLGLVTASRATTLGEFQLLFGVIVGIASGSFYAPMTATTARWFTRHRSLAVALVSAGPRAARGGSGFAQGEDRLRAGGRPRRGQARARRRARPPGGRREPLPRHARARGLLRRRSRVRLRLRRRDAALRDPRARVFRRANHGGDVRSGRPHVHAGDGAGPRGRRLAVRRVRQLFLDVRRLGRGRRRRRGHRAHVPPP